MGQFSDVRANAMLDSMPATVYQGLSTTTPTTAGANITEPVGNGYARKVFTLGAAAARKRENTTATQHIATGGTWGTITHAVYFDALTAGNFIGEDQLDAPRNMVDGAQMDFAIAAIDFDLP
jgi:hypothetical protein